MPRDIDHIVDTHRLATDRRNAGLPIWKWQIKIKDLLTGDDSDKVAISVGVQITSRLHEGLPGLLDVNNEVYDDDLDDIVYELRHVSSVDELNQALDSLYDWADVNRLWLG